MGFRGPFFDLERPGAPMVFVADDELELELGQRLEVEYRAPEAGLELGTVRANGQLDLPAWKSLAKLEHVVFHHQNGDPRKSFMVPVQVATPATVNGHLRLETVPGAPTTLHKASKLEGYQGPFLPLAAQESWVEVRSAKNLADTPGTALPQRGRVDHAWASRKVLVPLDTSEAGVDGLYSPTPDELIQAGMRGPHRASAKGALAARLGGFGLLAAWMAWAFAAWVMLPAFPKLRAALVLGGAIGIVLPFEALYFSWLAATAALVALSWSRRARD
jgi:hypothetical protein